MSDPALRNSLGPADTTRTCRHDRHYRGGKLPNNSGNDGPRLAQVTIEMSEAVQHLEQTALVIEQAEGS